jgi:hypothetical protein
VSSTLPASHHSQHPKGKENARAVFQPHTKQILHSHIHATRSAATQFQLQDRLTERGSSQQQARQACQSVRETRPARTAPPVPEGRVLALHENPIEVDGDECLAQAFYLEASRHLDVRHSNERKQTYTYARLFKATQDQAREISKYGQLYFEMSQDQRLNMRKLLDRYGVSHSPLCWPRALLELPCRIEDCPVLGKGSFNKVYLIRINGEDYAFKPLHLWSKVKQMSATRLPFSSAGKEMGLQLDSFHPELRGIAAACIAEAMGLLGKVMSDVKLVIVNKVPGMLSKRVLGSTEGRTNLWNALLPYTAPEARAVSAWLKADHCKTKEERDAAMRKRGVFHLNRCPGGYQITGAMGKRNPHAKLRYASPSYNRGLLDVQVLLRLLNHPDVHPMNLMYERLGDDAWKVMAIDPDEALAPINPETLTHNPIVGASACPMPLRISATTRLALQSQRCREMNENLRTELVGYLPQCDLDNFANNERSLREADLPDESALEFWAPGKELKPGQSLLDRIIGFSANENWDSDDTDDDEPEPDCDDSDD